MTSACTTPAKSLHDSVSFRWSAGVGARRYAERERPLLPFLNGSLLKRPRTEMGRTRKFAGGCQRTPRSRGLIQRRLRRKQPFAIGSTGIESTTRLSPAERPANTTRGIAKKGCSVGLSAYALRDRLAPVSGAHKPVPAFRPAQTRQLTLHPFFARTCPNPWHPPRPRSGP
jgi:hypothetical protein